MLSTMSNSQITTSLKSKRESTQTSVSLWLMKSLISSTTKRDQRTLLSLQLKLTFANLTWTNLLESIVPVTSWVLTRLSKTCHLILSCINVCKIWSWKMRPSRPNSWTSFESYSKESDRSTYTSDWFRFWRKVLSKTGHLRTYIKRSWMLTKCQTIVVMSSICFLTIATCKAKSVK